MNNIPNHVGIILDGNRRWATRRGLAKSEGHRCGFERLKKTAKYILNKGVKVLSVFAFSTENFNREAKEVEYLMKLFKTSFKNEVNYFYENNIKVVFSGRKDRLDDELLTAMSNLEDKTKDCTNGTLNICLNYGGQYDILDAAKKMAKDYSNRIDEIDSLDLNEFNKYFYHDLPSIDLLIRTSGEVRISNFMLYHLAYSELYFTSVCFPDFDENEFDKALDEFNNRHITKGGN